MVIGSIPILRESAISSTGRALKDHTEILEKIMNSTFLNALQTNDARTENNMTTHSTSLSALVDFFGIAGSARKMSENDILNYFVKAISEERTIALKLLYWARDVRGGAGERRLFRAIIRYLADNHPEDLRANVQYIPEYGRWDDVLELFDTKLELDALRLISSGLTEDNGLCAKWMPRKGAAANKIRSYLQVTPKQYRKGLVAITNVVEQAMCSGEFKSIDYSKLPSLAAARYQKAFEKHDPRGYQAYIDSLQKGETKINASAVYPYDIVKSLTRGNAAVANEQWKALPDYLAGSEGKNILPVVDTSGSMTGLASGGTVTCMDVSVSLGMYLAERNRGAFKDHFITFSGSPKLQKLTGSLSDRHRQLSSAEWGMNTNIKAVFELVLNQAVRNRVPHTDMPTQILIISDMQFDQCNGSRSYSSWGRGEDNCTAFNPNVVAMAKQMYAQAGYSCPEIIFWNVRASVGQSPVQITDTGVALVSGFSPAIMKNVLNASEMADCQITPLDIMMNVVNDPRYAVIQ